MEEISKLRRGTVQIASCVAILLLFAATVSAYTIVMRSGRRVEIPSRFVVTQATLTYEVSPGIQITLVMAAIDTTATEKANNEQPGSLSRRAQADSRERAGSIKTRTITNRDLESSMRRRRESEAAYEIRRKQLGLPTLEESRKQAAVIPDLTGTELEQKLIADRESESYWRARASALRTEMAALDAELSHRRMRIEEVSVNSLAGSSFRTGTVLPFVSFGNVGPRHSFPGRGMRPTNVFESPRAGSQLNGRVRFGGGETRGQVFLNPGGFPRRRPFGNNQSGWFPAGAPYGQIGFIGQAYDYSFERSALVTRFNELAAARAGLNARWRELEDEARRAGASPGWLRR
jgi:hypothetical protein